MIDGMLKYLLDEVRQQVFDPQLYARLEKAITDALTQAYKRGGSDMETRMKYPDTTGK